MARIGHEELFAMAAFALPDGVHAPHLTAPLSRRQSFRPSHPTQFTREENLPDEEKLF
jgi:hypothetical protein